jgi:uncharacterized SAM-binding protein YcdF (DUF218 family)
MLILSFTSLPYRVYHWLGTHNAQLDTPPGYIVVMGAGGMPGPGGLMRSHFAAEAALTFENAEIIIALPADTANFYGSDAYRMFRQMMLMDIDSSRFLFETTGTNTYTQAVEIRRMLSKATDRSLLIVTSPEHVRRCLLTFRKCGFEHVGGLPAFEAAFSNDLLLTEEEREKSVQPVDRRVDVRYNMWNYLRLQIMILREFTALGYYRLKGYI